jgi:alpha-L-fucosidase
LRTIKNKKKKEEMRKSLFIIFALLATTLTYAQKHYTVDDAWRDAQIKPLKQKSQTAQQRSLWFRNAKLGMFIHWNMSSLAMSEISLSKQFYDDDGENLLNNPRPTLIDCHNQEHHGWLDWFLPAIPKEVYDNLYKSFYPAMYNADSIVDMALRAGVKYIVMISKHCDGFCMWDSKYTDYDIMSTPYKRDLLGEMADACHRKGMRFCIYYSQRDWHHPDYTSATIAKYDLYMRNQISEILTKYAPVDAIFFDAKAWNGEKNIWEQDKLFKTIYSINPNILINDRCGVPGDYYTPEQRIGAIDMDNTWESCMTFTGSWAWKGFGSKVISTQKCLDYLISCVGGNGNLLMNVGPLPTGQIDPRENDRLTNVGKWLQTNGDAIYCTKGGPIKPAKWGTTTRKGNRMYLLVNDWSQFPSSLPNMNLKIKSVSVNNKHLDFKVSKDGSISFSVPDGMKDKYVTVIRIDTNKDLTNLPLINI